MNYYNKITSVTNKVPKQYKIASIRFEKDFYSKLELLAMSKKITINQLMNDIARKEVKDNNEVISRFEKAILNTQLT